MKVLLFLVLAMLVNFVLFAQILTPKSPLCFIENKGQITDQYGKPGTDINYRLAAAPGLNVFIGCGAIHYQFAKPTADTEYQTNRKAFAKKRQQMEGEGKVYEMGRLDMVLDGADKDATLIAEEQEGYYEQYYLPGVCADDAKARAFTRITYRNIYPHIDWVLYIKDNQLEYDFVVKPGGKVNDIKIRYGGANSVQVTNDAVTAIAPLGRVREGMLYCYEQETGHEIAACFTPENNEVRIKAHKYGGTLVIDPRLEWATYYGDTGTLCIRMVADTLGNLYATGATESVLNIATPGAYDTVYRSNGDAYLAKFNGSGAIQWGTYYGSAAGGDGICADDSNNIYIGGNTSDTIGIATAGAYQTVYGGGSTDGFIAKFSSEGNLLWGTYYGGMGREGMSGITWNNGSIYVTGSTGSPDNMATIGAYKTTFSYISDTFEAFIAKFNSNGILSWGTYYGGPGTEGWGITCDSSGNTYITGFTGSRDSIATTGAYQGTYGGGTTDCFVAKFNDSGTALLWGTYYGGNEGDDATGITSDNSGNVYITGITYSTSGIATPGAYKTFLDGDNDAFLAKFTDGGGMLWATYYGGNSIDGANGIAMGNGGDVYIAGGTSSTDSIATTGAYQSSYNGFGDAFAAAFSSNGQLVWGTYFGSNNEEVGNCIAFDNTGHFYLAGSTYSPDGIATDGAFDTTYRGGEFGAGGATFIAKFDTLVANGVPETTTTAETLKIYPSPASDFVTISWQAPVLKSRQVSVLDRSGRQVYATITPANSKNVTIPVSTLPSATYLCIIEDGNLRQYGIFVVAR